MFSDVLLKVSTTEKKVDKALKHEVKQILDLRRTKVTSVQDQKRRPNVIEVIGAPLDNCVVVHGSSSAASSDATVTTKGGKFKKAMMPGDKVKPHVRLLLGCKSAESKAKWLANLAKCIGEVGTKQRSFDRSNTIMTIDLDINGFPSPRSGSASPSSTPSSPKAPTTAASAPQLTRPIDYELLPRNSQLNLNRTQKGAKTKK